MYIGLHLHFIDRGHCLLSLFSPGLGSLWLLARVCMKEHCGSCKLYALAYRTTFSRMQERLKSWGSQRKKRSRPLKLQKYPKAGRRRVSLGELQLSLDQLDTGSRPLRFMSRKKWERAQHKRSRA
jgi:hypothetical protein